MRLVRYDSFTGVDGLVVVNVPIPQPGPGQVLVWVHATCISPGSVSALNGAPYTPARDIAGRIVGVSNDVGDFTLGEEVLGWLQDWNAHAEFVAVPATQVVPKPPGLDWDVAGSLFVGPMAGLAGVLAVSPQRGETVVVAGASGGVGYTSAQLAHREGARVIGVASPRHHDRLLAAGIEPVPYGDGLAGRINAVSDAPIDAFIDTVGEGYVELAVALGVNPARINTVVDFGAARRFGATTLGTMQAGGSDALRHLADLAATGELDVPIAAAFPLDDVRDAYRVLIHDKPAGRVVLHPLATITAAPLA